MKFRYDFNDDEFEDEIYQDKIKSNKHFIKNKDLDEMDFKHLKKEQTKKMKKSIKNKYKKYDIEDE